MTSKQRLIDVLSGKIPDCVPVCPDFSNMIPAKMTGLPFWDIYLFQEIPIWKAYIDCAKYFDIDALADCHGGILFEDLDADELEKQEFIVFRSDDRIVTQKAKVALGHYHWENTVSVYYKADPPTERVRPGKLGMEAIPTWFESVERRSEPLYGEKLLRRMKEEMGDQGIVGMFCGTTSLLDSEDDIYAYYDDPERYYALRDERLDYYVRRFEKMLRLNVRPDFICSGASGSLVFQTPTIFRELGLPIVKTISRMCKENELFCHVHSCGPETALVKILAEETDVTVVDPLEISPMGDSDLRELKAQYGQRLVLKGNLHTTDVMLRGTAQDVVEKSRAAIEDAAAGGRFILSTGDQCGRDTPKENLFAMVETARTYGCYSPKSGEVV